MIFRADRQMELHARTAYAMRSVVRTCLDGICLHYYWWWRKKKLIVKEISSSLRWKACRYILDTHTRTNFLSFQLLSADFTKTNDCFSTLFIFLYFIHIVKIETPTRSETYFIITQQYTDSSAITSARFIDITQWNNYNANKKLNQCDEWKNFNEINHLSYSKNQNIQTTKKTTCQPLTYAELHSFILETAGNRQCPSLGSARTTAS